jgi:hypothetical protein
MLLTAIHTHTQHVHILGTHIPTDLYSYRTTEEQAITFATFSAAVVIFFRTFATCPVCEQRQETEIDASCFLLFVVLQFIKGWRGRGHF